MVSVCTTKPISKVARSLDSIILGLCRVSSPKNVLRPVGQAPAQLQQRLRHVRSRGSGGADGKLDMRQMPPCQTKVVFARRILRVPSREILANENRRAAGAQRV